MDRLDYKIGRFTLKPFRQLLDGGAAVPIGRKALDLLSVLAKAEGALVTKDELMAAVWPKAIVEDNAIQVHIAALRKALGQDAELLTTVHGLGYRLAAAADTSSTDPKCGSSPEPVPAAAPWLWTRHILSAVLSAVAIATAAASLWPVRDRLFWSPRLGEARVAVLPFDSIGPGRELRGVADGLVDEIVSQLSDNQLQVVSPGESKALRGGDTEAIDRLGADLVLDGTVRGDGKAIGVRVHLDDVREHVVLWSGEFHGHADATEALEASVAAQAADVLYWARTGRSGKVRLDAPSLAAFIAGRESTTGVRNGSNEAALSSYRKVAAAEPDFSWGHSGVAVSDAFELIGRPASPATDVLRAEAQREARRALALEPHNGEAYLALELALPTLDWTGREALLIQGAAAEPSFEPGAMMEGRLLWVAGRGHDALPWLWRAHELNPLHNGETWSLAIILASEGHPGDSRALVAQMQTQWPDQRSTRDARFWTSVISGATDDTLAMLANPAALSACACQTNQRSDDAWRAALMASSSKDAAARVDAVKMVMAAADAGSLNHGDALTLLTMLGDLDDAFAQAQLYRPVNPYMPPYLFLPPTAPLRSDPRFMEVAAKLGLVAYWRATGHWPDFCSEPGLPYDCRSEAAKIAAMSPPPTPMIGAGP
ncbi:MAG TPA: winged helix-turn-helix domain-containing protein [Rhizomicrobium sp.]|nr:winged helix-turn-helix domain-containing protein [Rhizomicrobium sp.]